MSKTAAREWVITVRLPDGAIRYFCEPTDRQGQAEWSPRENQAKRFEVEVDAIRVSRSFATNDVAKEYAVVAER